MLIADARCTCPRCVLYGEQDRSLSPTQDASAAPVILRLRGRRRFKMSYIWKIPNCRWPSLYWLLKWCTSPPCRWLAFILQAHTPGLWPGYEVATLRGLCPWRVVRGVAVRCRLNQIKKCLYMLNLRNVDRRNCPCYAACCEKQGLLRYFNIRHWDCT